MINEKLDKYQNKSEREAGAHSAKAFMPLMFALVLLLGILIGGAINGSGNSWFSFKSKSSSNPSKLVSVINFIEDHYVDSVQKEKLIDNAIASMLQDLDPHSYYISADELAAFTEPLEGAFDGIGVEFLIQRDSLFVVRTIAGGPSAKAGIKAGDRIVKVDDRDITGATINSESVTKQLKGPSGTKVKVSVMRRGESQLLDFMLERDGIPIESVSASFLVNPETGYVKLERFAKPTYPEFMKAVHQLKDQGAKKLVIDLRGNGGGYMEPATKIIEEFLTPDKLIVYTEGVHQKKDETRSTKNGLLRDMEVVVIIDQNSASASEIVAGALQDWDRSITVGRRSFGKGLVQHEQMLKDKSAIRLTVARYYTPTGRCIQKPYGDTINYSADEHDRLLNGELLTDTNIRFSDSLKFTTPGGRTVYGGGGIMPDVFVPLDSLFFDSKLLRLSSGSLLRDFAFNYVDENRARLERDYTEEQMVKNFLIDDSIISKFLAAAKDRGVTYSGADVIPFEAELKLRIKSQIARNLFGDKAQQQILLSKDDDFSKALEVFGNFDGYVLRPR
ncbi:MAG: S41 family peptidase [Flavobacteriales bacterium]|nr:S41 family peptidase [Flavobacteriales bacterium]